MCVYATVCTHVCDFLRRPEKALDPLESGLQVVVDYPVWVLGTEL